MLPSVPLPLCHDPCPVLHSRYCCGGFTCCDVPLAFRMLLVSRYTFRVLGLLVRSSAVLGPVLRVRSRAGFRPCYAFGISHSVLLVPHRVASQLICAALLVPPPALFVRPYLFRSCFKRNPENRGVQKRMRRGAEATRGGPYDNTCNHDDSRRQGTSISDISSTTTSISGGDPDKRRDYNPSTLRQPLHSQIPKTLRPKSHTDHTCHPLHSQTPSLVEGIPTKGGTITPPHIVNPSTYENPGFLH